MLCDPDFIFETLENVLGDSPPTDLADDDSEASTVHAAPIDDQKLVVEEGR